VTSLHLSPPKVPIFSVGGESVKAKNVKSRLRLKSKMRKYTDGVQWRACPHGGLFVVGGESGKAKIGRGNMFFIVNFPVKT